MAELKQERTFWERLILIDRRVIYLIIALAMTLPFFFQMGLPIPATKEVQDIYDHIEALTPSDVVIISADFDPSVSPELLPMFDALFRHCLKAGVKVMAMSLAVQGPGLIEPVIHDAAKDYNKTNGLDYAFLGWQYGFTLVIMNMMEDLKQTFPVDYYGTRTVDLPILQGVETFADYDLIVSLAGSAVYMNWLLYAHEPYNVPLACGVTAVSAADVYPYIQSGQFLGMLGGLKGAAEYETLIEEKRMATMGMEAQNWAHIIIILFIIIGNIGYLIIGRKK
ncbi:MAG TPA: hypothetical protein ENN07_05300 [candidate division Zixibacteria bacterium]|nr:hypothetical protein [candidate division Zixibacteria bacterium]